MQIGAFEIREPVPELRDPHIFAILQPWIDVGNVGTLVLGTLETQFNAAEIGRLARPSTFYDLTRYRPMLYRRHGERIVEMPNTIVRYGIGEGDHDFVFMHILEPHSNGEDFVESLIELAEKLNVRRYCQVGAMYGSTPHTRPLLASGQATDPGVQEMLERAGVRTSNYEGPTSMMAIATQELVKRGVETLSALIQLPPYARLEEDHRGQEKLLKLLSPIYSFNINNLAKIAQDGDRQYAEIDRMAQREPRVRSLVKQLEEAYDSEVGNQQGEIGERGPDAPPLAPDVEDFLRELEQRDDS